MTIVDWGLDDEEPKKVTREAEFTTRCSACDESILPGDMMALEDGEWIHEECAE